MFYINSEKAKKQKSRKFILHSQPSYDFSIASNQHVSYNNIVIRGRHP